MKTSLSDIEARVEAALRRRGALDGFAGRTAAWLEACGYPGLKIIAEALSDDRITLPLERDPLGLDLQGVSCVFIGEAVANEVEKNGRAFLRNVRHGLFLLPRSVEANYGIGCPVDPAFALGGERLKNPYVEKLEAAARDGVVVDPALWAQLAGET